MTVDLVWQRKRKTKVQIAPTGRVVRTHTAKCLVKSTEPLDTAEVPDLLGVSPFDPHETDSSASLRDIDVDELDTQSINDSTFFTFLATVVWSTETPERRDSENPLAQRPKIKWNGNEVTEAVYRDRNGNAVLNSAKDYFFDPALEVGVIRPVLTIQKNLPVYDPQFAFDYAGTINSTEFLGAPAGTLRMKAPVAEEQFSNGVVYWTVTYEFEYNPRGWDPLVLNQGLRRLVGTGETQKKEDILDPKTRVPITEPVPLDAEGQPIPVADLPYAAIFIQPEVNRRKDFNALALI